MPLFSHQLTEYFGKTQLVLKTYIYNTLNRWGDRTSQTNTGSCCMYISCLAYWGGGGEENQECIVF